MAVPASCTFRADGAAVGWLHSPERTLDRQLFVLDLLDPASTPQVLVRPPAEGAVREGALSLDEALRRERARDTGLGVSRYAWAPAGNSVLVPLSDGLHVQDEGEALRVLVPGAPDLPVIDARWSPDASAVAFVQGGEVWVVGADASSAPRRLTSGDEAPGVTRGLAEFVAQEELDRPEGWWWSPDGRHIAFVEVDERRLPVLRLVRQGGTAVGPTAEEEHRYPFAGGPNAAVRLGIVDVADGTTTWTDVAVVDDGYLARVHWLDAARLAVEVLDRRQLRLELRAVDVATGASSVLLVEESETWVNVADCFRSLEGGGFLWSSERTGHRHLERRNRDGALERVLTQGEWEVTSVAGLDELAGTVWCTTTRASPIERHLEAVPLDGGEPHRLTERPGVHTCVVHRATRRFLDTASTLGAPPVITLRSLDDGSAVRVLHDEPDPRLDELDLVIPEPHVIADRDGVELHALLWRPDGPGPFPLAVSVYGGPHVQRVVDAWASTVQLRAQHLCARGIAVLSVDNRGSAGRGLVFEAALRHRLGDVEVRDQVDAVRWAVAAGVADAERVAIFGWSYGGYLAAMCLARAPEVFSVGVAGAPVTDWDGYDTCYTERYLGLPDENEEGYRASSVLTHAAGIRGRLLLVHGLMDENVHFRHTARLVNELVRHQVDHELVLLPDERHGPRQEADRAYVERRVCDFLARHLGAG